MKKILYRRVVLEITRRCQLKCAHCMRGDAQNLDMSEEIIDAFLEQTAGIERLFFTGGEPTLAVDKMRYVLEQMMEQDIPLYAIGYITNGVEFSEQQSDFLIKAHKYITKCRENAPIFDLDPRMKSQPKISVGISLDNFHAGVDFEHTLSQYKHLFCGMSLCHAGYVNNSLPHRVGRGKDLEYATNDSPHEALKNAAIGIAEKWNDVACDDYLNPGEMFERCDTFIPCSICVTAKGMIMPSELEREYIQIDAPESERICQIQNKHFPPIVDEIKKFNIGRLPCYLTNYTPTRITLDDALAFMCFKKKHSINTNPNPLDRSIWGGLSYEDMMQIAETLNVQRDHHLSLYKAYLLTRVAEYSTIEEIKKDFPQNNGLFYHDVMKMKESFYFPKHFVDWICDNKDEVKYRVEDDLIPFSDKIGLLTDDQTHNSSLLLNDLIRIKKQRESSNTIADAPACR